MLWKFWCLHLLIVNVARNGCRITPGGLADGKLELFDEIQTLNQQQCTGLSQDAIMAEVRGAIKLQLTLLRASKQLDAGGYEAPVARNPDYLGSVSSDPTYATVSSDPTYATVSTAVPTTVGTAEYVDVAASPMPSASTSHVEVTSTEKAVAPATWGNDNLTDSDEDDSSDEDAYET